MSFDGSSQVGIVSNTSPDYNQPSLPVSQIRRDGGTQVRIAQNQFTIDEYAEKMVAGAIFPPVVVFFDGSEYWLADGFHRINAAIQAGIDHINVDIKDGDKRDAILYAVGANSSHGLRRTNEDKRNAVLLLLNDPVWVKWSNYEIARACAVSESLVRSLRLERSDKSERTYTTKHGTVARMNTERIGKTANIAPEVRELIRDTPIIENTDDITRLSSLEPEKQKEVVEKVISGESKDVKSAIIESNREERIEALGSPELPTGEYSVILADPPWRYQFSETSNREIENQYPTMDLSEIRSLTVPAADDSILFMWTTAPKLEEAFSVLNSWGFTYKTCAVWDKERKGMGYYFRINHELLLVATKGNFPAPAPENRPDSVIRSPRGEHSKKPDEIYEIIEAMYPAASKLEMFCRSPREGWNAWGNEV